MTEVFDAGRVVDVAIVGGGSAGLAAARSAIECGARDAGVIEREEYAGGVLPQCVHDGFGLHVYGESLTGPEYADRWVRRAAADGATLLLKTTVVALGRADDGLFAIDAVGAPLGGAATLRARALVVATGCRERTRGALQLPGSRPAGVMTAGAAQYLVNEYCSYLWTREE